LFALIKGTLQFFSARNGEDDPNDKDYASGDDDDQLQSSKAATPKTDAPRSPHDALVSHYTTVDYQQLMVCRYNGF
jgi:hypothetical protein